MCFSVAVLACTVDGAGLRMLSLSRTSLATGIDSVASALSGLSKSLQTEEPGPKSDWAVRLQSRPVTAPKPLIGILSQVMPLTPPCPKLGITPIFSVCHQLSFSQDAWTHILCAAA